MEGLGLFKFLINLGPLGMDIDWFFFSPPKGMHNNFGYSSIPPKYATWTWEECAYLAGRCAL
jgi:hypothetical protein